MERLDPQKKEERLRSKGEQEDEELSKGVESVGVASRRDVSPNTPRGEPL